jgi:hypothetical protein
MKDEIWVDKEKKQVSIQVSPFPDVVTLVTFRLNHMNNLVIDTSLKIIDFL